MKIICDTKGWPYTQADTASVLLDKILAKTGLESFFRDPLLITATLRNKLSKSHGAGGQTKVVAANTARYALNATAGAILLLIGETTGKTK